MSIPLLITFYIMFPAIVLYLCYRFTIFNRIGAVLLCYLAGIIIGNTGILPLDVYPMQETAADVSVVLALPLLLFTLDIKRWTRLAGKTILSMALATISIVVISTIGYLYTRNILPDAWKISGMLIGVYTGGTPNLAAIKSALDIDSTTFIIMHTYDTIISIIYILFVISIAQRVFLKFLKPFVYQNGLTVDDHKEKLEEEDVSSYANIFNLRVLKNLSKAFLLSFVIVGIAVFLSGMVSEYYKTTTAIITVTSLGIAASFITPVRKINKSFQLGMYLIYIFCVVVGSMANADLIMNINYTIMFYLAFAIFGSMILHALLCRIFNVDADTFIVTSTSAICSPPFVPLVADAIKNREVLLSGLTTGIIGYAIGNYLGISMAYLFRSIGL